MSESNSAQSLDSQHSTQSEQSVQSEPVFELEAAYTSDTGPMEVLEFASSPDSTDDEMLGALLALKNPSYWQNMMMPGYAISPLSHILYLTQ